MNKRLRNLKWSLLGAYLDSFTHVVLVTTLPVFSACITLLVGFWYGLVAWAATGILTAGLILRLRVQSHRLGAFHYALLAVVASLESNERRWNERVKEWLESLYKQHVNAAGPSVEGYKNLLADRVDTLWSCTGFTATERVLEQVTEKIKRAIYFDGEPDDAVHQETHEEDSGTDAGQSGQQD